MVNLSNPKISIHYILFIFIPVARFLWNVQRFSGRCCKC